MDDNASGMAWCVMYYYTVRRSCGPSMWPPPGSGLARDGDSDPFNLGRQAAAYQQAWHVVHCRAETLPSSPRHPVIHRGHAAFRMGTLLLRCNRPPQRPQHRTGTSTGTLLASFLGSIHLDPAIRRRRGTTACASSSPIRPGRAGRDRSDSEARAVWPGLGMSGVGEVEFSFCFFFFFPVT